MAKSYSEEELKEMTADEVLALEYPFKRLNPFPIDVSALFLSKEDAQKYAKGDEEDPDDRGLQGTSYVGQIIVIKENDAYNAYVIQEGGDLSLVGGLPSMEFRVTDEGNLEVSYDEGETWNDLGRVKGDATEVTIGENGNWFIDGVDTEKPSRGEDGDDAMTMVNSDITIGGTPFADMANGANLFENGKIKSGTTLEDLCMALFCKELHPTAGATYTFSSPVPTLSDTHSTGENYKLGTSIKVKVSMNDTSATQNIVVSGLTYGYVLDETTYKPEDGKMTKTLTPTKSDDSKKVSVSYSNFLEEEGSDYVAAKTNDGSEKTVYVNYGSNSYTTNFTGSTFTRESLSEDISVYPLTSYGNSESAIVLTNAGFTKSEIVRNGSSAVTITGYAPFYFGTYSTVQPISVSTVTGLTESNRSVGNTEKLTVPVGTKQIVLAVCSDEKTNFQVTSSDGAPITSKDISTVELSFGANLKKSYKVWNFAYATASKKEDIITIKLS